ncbi:MAG: dihydrofolate reductase [bacterium]|nr:dihydrofolate reductase [bacterium]
MSINLIVAVSRNNVIGKNGELPWNLPEDLKRFRQRTTGHVVLMGRKTWESIPEKYRPLPKRKNIVITRDSAYALPNDVERFTSIDDALQAHQNEIIFIIGGGEIYRQTMEKSDKIFLTRVHTEIQGDIFFPEIEPEQWKEIEREDHEDYSFITYARK